MHSIVDKVAIIGIDDRKNIHHVSETVESILGYSEQEIRTVFFSTILNEGSALVIDQGLASRKPLRFETVIFNRDQLPVEIAIGLFPNFGTETYPHSILLSDISARKQFREQAGWQAEIVTSSDDAIISKTLDGIITSWNPAAVHMFGYEEIEAIGKHISLIIPPERIEEEDMIINMIRSGQKLQHFETVRLSKDGTEKYLSLTISPVRNISGSIIGASKIARDISAKKIVERYQATLASIVDSSDDAIISKTLDGIINSWNKAAENMFGYSQEEAIGSHISMIIPADRTDEEDMIISNIKNGKKIDHFETIRVTKDGKNKNISLTVSPIKDLDGKIIGASKIARDIDFKIRAQKQTELYIKGLQELNDYKDDFMVMASHELKTPLTVILANLQILQEVMTEEKNLPLVKKIINKVFQMSSLVSNLLDVSKIQAGRLELEKCSFNIQNLIREIVESMQATTSKHQINLSFSHPNTIIYADDERLQHVVVNLINNAIKYSPKGGTIDVVLTDRGQTVQLSVRDKGVGIHHADLENIFERFYRGRIATSFSGSGVGLYISSQIIKKHGGKIWVESEEAEGSTFYFRIPK